MAEPTFASPIGPELVGPELRITDETVFRKTRIVNDGFEGIEPGHVKQVGDGLAFSTSPNEWTLLSADAPPGMRSIDLTHVRAVMRITGSDARALLAKVCALDFDDRMFPSGSAARTLVAETATEVVRDDVDGDPSYLLITSRSFGEYLYGVLADQAQEFAVGTAS